MKSRIVSMAVLMLLAVFLLGSGVSPARVATGARSPGGTAAQVEGYGRGSWPEGKKQMTQDDREAAAERAKAAGMEYGTIEKMLAAPGPGDIPDYFGSTPNYALSQLPELLPTPVPNPTALPTTFYFAEGTVRPDFDPYICIQNPGDTGADVTITYMRGDGTTATEKLVVPAHARSTVLPRGVLGTGDDIAHDFSAKVECTNGQHIIAERPMYFNYNKVWTGGHNVVGATEPGSVFYFAEGTTRPDFDPYICIQNPGDTDADVTITYMRGDGTTASEKLTVIKHSRSTVLPRGVLGTGDDVAHDFSAKVECTNGQLIVAERPMYFNYHGMWTGGHNVVGTTGTSTTFYLAEGTARPNFDPYICIQNPSDSDADIALTYMTGDSTIIGTTFSVAANSRYTVLPKEKLGSADDIAHDFSAKVECTNGQQIVVERPMYFNYNGMWSGGHDVIGIPAPATTFFFAEGTARPNFDPYICIQNPGLLDADVTITYMKGDGTTATEKLTVRNSTRFTVMPKGVLGSGDDIAHDFSAKVECTNGQKIIAERPMYFDYNGVWTGGHNAMGLAYNPDENVLTVVDGTGIRKFVDSLPGLGAENANNLGQYIPVAIPDTTTYPGSDYYEIELGEYTEQMHSDLPPTQLRGYRQTNTTDATVSQFRYLGPTIVAEKDRPVRIKFTNNLPTGAGGDLFLPCDTTVMGAGMGPDPGEEYTQNRAVIHLHGGNSPWISDGTPHQWIVPAGEATPYKKGVSQHNVPDMWFDASGNPVPEGTPGASNDPGEGSATYYYTNQQSGRLLFYHDHSFGITRLNVYAGDAAPYLLQDEVEKDLIARGLIPAEQIPLVIQDKTYVPDDTQLTLQDPTWDKALWGGMGNLWYPHVYMPNQNPADPSGFNTMARWHYGPWFWPPTTALTQGPQPNPYYDPVNAPWQPPEIPGTPLPSMVMESFFDTPVVNGTVYPTLDVEPKAYRFRILNAANDRFFNLALYKAESSAAMWRPDGKLNDPRAGEVKMVPAAATEGFPETWPTDGREGGVPDPASAGPEMIQIGTEGGFLPAPVVLPNHPITWNADPTMFNVGNVNGGTLILGTAERADVIVDFSQYAGQTLILYNDSPAPFPAGDPRYDYFTGSPDLTETGGSPGTQPGYGPNTRTIMQIKVAAAPAPAPYDLAALEAAFASTATTEGAFAASQDDIIVPSAAYNSAYNGNFPADPYVRIWETQKTFNTISGTELTIPFEPKAIQDEMGEAYDKEYGRMSGFLGLELPFTAAGQQVFVLYPYISPPVDMHVDSLTQGSEPVPGDGTQIWKITHNGVDTHTIHFHKYDVQVINRVAWDNFIMPPDPNELGWKETVRVNPLEDTIVAMRPVAPTLPFELPNSIRLIDPTKPEGALLTGGPGGFFDPFGNPVTAYGAGGVIANQYVNLGWEFVLHCHLLSHEEMDMMHSLAFAVAPSDPSNLTAAIGAGGVDLEWDDNSVNETDWVVQRATDPGGPWTDVEMVASTTGPDKSPPKVQYTDVTVLDPGTYYYRVIARNRIGSMVPNFPTMDADSAAVVSNAVVIP